MSDEKLIIFKAWNLPSYAIAKNKFKQLLEKDFDKYELNDLVKTLTENVNNLHFRIHRNGNYILFGDIDKYKGSIEQFITLFVEFLAKYYDLNIIASDFKYTKNIGKEGSYHFSIPKFHCSCQKMKSITQRFISYYSEFNKIVDTTIYTEKWFRYPNQLKNNILNTEHVIVYGDMIDFIVEYIPEYSHNVDNIDFTKNNTIKKKVKIVKKNDKECDDYMYPDYHDEDSVKLEEPIEEESDEIVKIEEKLKKSKNYFYYHRYRLFFDKCYKQDRFDDYQHWTSIGMALMNIYGMDGFELFNYYSSKSVEKYTGIENALIDYKSYYHNYDPGYKSGTIYYFAKQDNKDEYIKILDDTNLIVSEFEFAEKVKELAGDKFMYVESSKDEFDLYCFNGKFWIKNNILLRKFISTVLFEHYKDLINDVYIHHGDYNKYKKSILSLKKLNMVNNIVERYKEFGVVDDAKFDEKWWLLGFKDKVYDLQKGEFRDYRFNDYMTMTTGYKWRNPVKKEIDKVQNIIDKIMPIKEEKYLLLTLLSTSLEGRCLERFNLAN
jgi:hypothetical protein